MIKKERIACNKLIAEVFRTNIASNKIFTNAGYQIQEKDDLNVYTYNYSIDHSGHQLTKLLIIGTGGQGKVVLECACALDRYSQIAFLTNDLSAKPISDFPIFYEQEAIPSLHQEKNPNWRIPLSFSSRQSLIATANSRTSRTVILPLG